MPAAAVHVLVTMCSITCALVSASQIGVVGLTVGKEGWVVRGDYGLSRLPPIDLWECEVSLVQMDGLWPYGAFYGVLHSMYGLGFDRCGSLKADTESDGLVLKMAFILYHS